MQWRDFSHSNVTDKYGWVYVYIYISLTRITKRTSFFQTDSVCIKIVTVCLWIWKRLHHSLCSRHTYTAVSWFRRITCIKGGHHYKCHSNETNNHIQKFSAHSFAHLLFRRNSLSYIRSLTRSVSLERRVS